MPGEMVVPAAPLLDDRASVAGAAAVGGEGEAASKPVDAGAVTAIPSAALPGKMIGVDDAAA